MRTSSCGLSFVVVAGLLGGCSGTHADPVATRAGQAAGTKVWVMPSAGTPVLEVTAPADARCAVADGSLRFAGSGYEVQFWLIRGATSVDEGISRAPAQIADEFKDFATEHPTDLTIAGSAAKRLVGTGHEADDGDDGSADLIVFKVGDHVFVACNHGETLTPKGQQGLLMLTRTAARP